MESIQQGVFTQEQVQQLRQEWAEIIKPVKQFITVDELAEYLELSKSAIYKLTSKRELPHYNPGGKKIYFKKDEVDSWIEAGRVASDSEVFEQLSKHSINSHSSEL